MTTRPSHYFPIEVAIEPRTKADAEKLSLALQGLAAGHALFSSTTDAESGQTRLHGLSEGDLDALVATLRDNYGVNAMIGAPQVAYRETLGRAADVDYTHARQSSGGQNQFARIHLRLEPLPSGSGFVFESAIAGGSVPKEFIPGVEKGLRSVMNSGPLAGFPVIDFKATLTDGAYHDVDSSPLAFEIASRGAFRKAAEAAQMLLLEPIMKLDVATPEEHIGQIIGDLHSRRARIVSQEMRGEATVVHALAPQANLFGYQSRLGDMTGGGATATIVFDHFAPTPSRPPDDVFPPAIGMRA